MRFSRRQFLRVTSVAAAGLSLHSLSSMAANQQAPLFPKLGKVSGKFTFGLIADTHIRSERDNANNSQLFERHFRATIAEINAIEPQPAFVAHLGDVVSTPTEANFANFKAITKTLKPLTVLTQGNHDGSEPWDLFCDAQKAVNGCDQAMLSFDCGGWHFIVIPFGFTPGGGFDRKLVDWLRSDLAANRGKPSVLFVHHHLLPQGLTQLESYTYEKPVRTRLLQTLAQADNVRYVFCGHVHNGIQASLKTAWSWRGINFVTVPTCVPPRNFGEEFPQFAAGQPTKDQFGGGYYMLVDVDGDKVRVRGRLNGVKDEYVFPDKFRPYEDQEQLWFKDAIELPINPNLVNGSFENGLDGWSAPYRYISDADPGFVWKPASGQVREGKHAAFLFVREKGQRWSHDEITEIYQMVKAPPGDSPLFKANYFLEQPDVGGGGYVRLCAFADKTMKFHVLLDWGNGDRAANMRMGSHMLFATTGERGRAPDLAKLGRARQAMFWRLPADLRKWNEVTLDLAAAYDQAIGRPGAYAGSGITHLQIGLGVWCASAPGSRSAAWFDEISLVPAKARGAAPAIAVNSAPLPISSQVFTTDFVKDETSRPDRKRQRAGVS